MRTTTTYLISFILAVSLNSVTPFKSYVPINKPEPPPLSEDLIKIKIWTCQEHTSLWNNLFNCFDASLLNEKLFTSAAIAIGLQEMRSSLGFPPTPKWSSFDPSKEDTKDFSSTFLKTLGEMELLETARNARRKELESAPTTLAYYELREPEKRQLKIVSKMYAENVQSKAVKYLDGRDPVIREIFKNEFNKVRQLDTRFVNREVVDRMIAQFKRIYKKMEKVIGKKFNDANWISEVPCKESNHSADHFTFVNNDSLMSNLQKLLETTKPRFLPANLPNINSLLANIPYFTEQELEMFWKNTFSAYEGKEHTSEIVKPAITIISTEELLSAIGMSDLPAIEDGFFSWSADKSVAEESVERYLAQKTNNGQLSDYTKRRDTSLLFKDVLDKRFPEVRIVYKLRFQEMLQKNEGMVDKEVLDHMIDEVKTMKEYIAMLLM